MKVVSWNVNGLARCRRKGFLKFLADVKPDVICCQEIKGQCTLNVPGYLPFWDPAKRANYSGTLVLTKRQLDLVLQEVFASFLIFNFTQAAAWAVDASQGTAKYKRHVNFSDAVFACCAFLRRSAADPLPLLRRRLLPLRPGRTAPRPKITGNRISACYASAR